MADTTKPHVAILGAGNIGCFLGGCLLLEENSCSLTFIGRSNIQAQIENYGLVIKMLETDRAHRFSPTSFNFVSSSEDCSKADIILVCVKSQHTFSAIADISTLLHSSSIIVSMQNGVRNPSILREAFPNNIVVGGIVPFNVIQKTPYSYIQTTSGDIHLEKSANHSKAQVIAQLFNQNGLNIRVSENFSGLQWTKLLMNLNNALNALAGIPIVEELEKKPYRRIVAQCISEALLVLRANNIRAKRYGNVIPALLPIILKLPNFLFTRVAKQMIAIDANARSSMYDDLSRKKSTEIDYLNGEIISLAKQRNIATPYNNTIVKLIKKAEFAALGSPQLSAEYIIETIKNSNDQA